VVGPMRGKLVLLIATLMIFGSPAGASNLERQTDGVVHYQNDAGRDRDAPDSCDDLTSEWNLEVDPEFKRGTFTGALVAIDDEEDNYGLNISSAEIGSLVRVDLQGKQIEMDLSVLVPGCQLDVFETSEQTEPASASFASAAAAGEKTIFVTNDPSSSECNTTIKWVINQIDAGPAPASIHVKWSSGHEADVPLFKTTKKTAHYQTDLHPQFTVSEVSAQIYAGWDGRFNQNAFSCGAVEYQPPVKGDGYVIFMPKETGVYGIRARAAETQDPMLNPIVIPLSCHAACRAAIDAFVEQLGYSLGVDLNAVMPETPQ
jgi:hypothetical protein